MAEKAVLHNGQGSAWHLLLQFVPESGVGGERQSVERVAEALGGLGLQPAQQRRVGGAVVEALQRASLRQRRDRDNSPLLIRVWISSASKEAAARSSSEAERARRRKRRGWGFFMLERQEGAAQDTQVESVWVIEAYLYQENSHMR